MVIKKQTKTKVKTAKENAVKPKAKVSKTKTVQVKTSKAKKVKVPTVKSKSTDKSKKVDFQLNAPDAKNVVVTGNFTDWNIEGVAMKRLKNGVWKTGLKLQEGRYEYKFIVDGDWWTDPVNNQTVENIYGNLNSVVEI